MKQTTKVLAYIVDDERVCVFRQPASPEAGVQVPAGTVEPGEDVATAVLREAAEETGLTNLRVVASLGTTDYDMAQFGRDEVQRRHIFHLACDGRVPEQWTHAERYADGKPPIEFQLYWLPITEARSTLIAGHGALLHRIGTTGAEADELLPFRPTPYFLAQLRRQGVAVEEVLSFTGLNTIARLAGDQVAKGFFGYYTVLRHVPDQLRPECYGYYWYRDLDKSSYESWLAKFRQEALLLEQLRGHPNIIELVSHALDEEIPYYVMRLAAGGSLDALLRGLRADGSFISPGLAASVAQQILNGLAALHELGFVHRDLTPENVFVDGDRAVIGDLGYARALHGAPEPPAPKDPMFYWPPEFDDGFHTADAAADVYSFGMVLHRMLTHTLPRFGSSLDGVASRYGDEVATFVGRCIAPDVRDRFPSIRGCTDAFHTLPLR